MAEIKRLPTIKVRVSDIVNGKYFHGSREEMRPSYVITEFGEKISRVNVVATVIDKFESEDGNHASITIDDGTEAIRAKVFREDVELLNDLEPGDMVSVIGKLKEYNGEVYINGEIFRKVEDVNFDSLVKLEILYRLLNQKKIVDEVKSLVDQMSREELVNYVKERYDMSEEVLQVILESKKKEIDYKPKILEVIEKLDDGSGVEIGKLFEILDLPENVIENAISCLFASGAIYEPTVGKIRKV
jgi:RPA family protein